MQLGLGIDTGGTYTDAVILDLETSEIVASAKALTTRSNLAIGIENSIDRLISGYLDASQIKLVSVSTTLSTNALVEGKGGSVCLILIGYDPVILAEYGPEVGLPTRGYELIRGRHGLQGEIVEELDSKKLIKVVRKAEADGVDAFAVSEYLGVRNPEYEILARDIIKQHSDLPVVCGHELTGELNSLKRAATAMLNARLIPIIRELIASLKGVLQKRNISAPLMIVKGDGSLISCDLAFERPIETILSGPAASAVGAHNLSKIDDAIVVDMGGTTTDIAVLKGGIPRVVASGARVGGWSTSVTAADIRTSGIGGDSHISRTREGTVKVGPQRVIPLCVAASEFPEVERELERILSSGETSDLVNVTDFLTFTRMPSNMPLSQGEQEVISCLKARPHSLFELSSRLGVSHPCLVPVKNLEAAGVITRIGLTPTDILHVSGEYTAWNRRASLLGARIFARELGVTVEELVRMVHDRIAFDISKEIVTKLVSDESGIEEPSYDRVCSFFISKALSGSRHGEGRGGDTGDGVLSCSLKAEIPIVAIGAPVSNFMPDVAKRLNTQLVIPNHAGVANAVGAVTGCMLKTVEILISPVYTTSGIECYTLHTPREKRSFRHLEEAYSYARSAGIAIANEEMQRAGACDIEYKVDLADKTGTVGNGKGTPLFLEGHVIITAVGRPRMVDI
ncbi:MAG: hydantoinase/oxoprolinase family protein [Firmicutes bacterium]|nr:hydantoinase/oxoprolinase family protein [Bacillota bacterium]